MYKYKYKLREYSELHRGLCCCCCYVAGSGSVLSTLCRGFCCFCSLPLFFWLLNLLHKLHCICDDRLGPSSSSSLSFTSCVLSSHTHLICIHIDLFRKHVSLTRSQSVWICFTSVMIDTIIEHGEGGRLCEKMLHDSFLVSLYSIAIWLYTQRLYKWIGLDWVETWHWLNIDIISVALVLLVKYIECRTHTHTEHSIRSHRLYITSTEWIHTYSLIHTNFHFSLFLLSSTFPHILLFVCAVFTICHHDGYDTVDTFCHHLFCCFISHYFFLRCFFIVNSCCSNRSQAFCLMFSRRF